MKLAANIAEGLAWLNTEVGELYPSEHWASIVAPMLSTVMSSDDAGDVPVGCLDAFEGCYNTYFMLVENLKAVEKSPITRGTTAHRLALIAVSQAVTLMSFWMLDHGFEDDEDDDAPYAVRLH